MNNKKRPARKRAVPFDQEMMSAHDVAEYCIVPVQTVYSWNRRGVGPKRYRIGKYIRYRKSEVDSWISGNESSAAT